MIDTETLIQDRLDEVKLVIRLIEDCHNDPEINDHYDCKDDIGYAIDQLEMIRAEL